MTSLTSGSLNVLRPLDSRAGLSVPHFQPFNPDRGVIQAALEQENFIGSFLINEAISRDPKGIEFDEPVEVFEAADATKAHSISNPYRYIQGFEDFAIEFMDARTLGEIERIKKRIMRELDNRRILAQAGIGGFAATFGAAVLDPLIFIPGVNVAKSAKGAFSVGKVALQSALAGGGIVGAQELALHQTQLTRTGVESAINITGGVVLSGLLGGAIGKLTKRQLAAATRQIDSMNDLLTSTAPGARRGPPVPPPVPTRSAAELANSAQAGDRFIAGSVGEVEILARTGRELIIRTADGKVGRSNLDTLETGFRRGVFRPVEPHQGTRPTLAGTDPLSIAAEARGQAPKITVGEDPLSLAASTPLNRPRVEMLTGTPELIRSGRIAPVRPDGSTIPPRRVQSPNDLRQNQQVAHPKYGEGVAVREPGDTATPGGLPKFNEPGNALHNGMIVRLRDATVVKVLRVFRVHTARFRAEDALIRKGKAAKVSTSPAGKARVRRQDGKQAIIDITDIEGIERADTGNFDTLSELVEVQFPSGIRRVRASLLTTRVGGKRQTNSLLASAGDVMDGTVPDPVVRMDDIHTRPVRETEGPPGREPLGDIKAKGDDIPRDDGMPNSTTTSTQIMRAAGVDVAKASIFGFDFNKLAKWLSPRLQMKLSRLKYMRWMTDHLIESPVRNAGDAVKVPSAEVRVKLRRARLEAVRLKIDELYLQHLRSDPNATVGAVDLVFGFRDRGAGKRGKLTQEEFWNEIPKSLRGTPEPDGTVKVFDVHEIAEVQQAARLMRKEILTPMREELIALKVLPPEIRDFPGYMTRLYQTHGKNSLRKRQNRNDFIDAILSHRAQQHVLKHGNLDDFSEKGIRKELDKVVQSILGIPEGRMFPGDVPLRGPMLERTLDIPDALIEKWLVNDGQRLINYYVRSLGGDIEIIKRFGLIREDGFLIDTRKGVVAALRAAEDGKTIEPLRARAKQLRKRHGGRQFTRILKTGDGKRGITSMKELANKIRKAKTDAEAEKVLEAYDDKLIHNFSTGEMFLVFDRLETQWLSRINKVGATERVHGKELAEKHARRLRKQMQRDIFNFRLARDEVRGMAALPDDPTALGPRIARGLRMWTLMAVGGKIALSSVPDMGLPLMNHGFADPKVFGGFLSEMLGGFRGVKHAKEDLEFMLGPSEAVTGHRNANVHDITQEFIPKTKIERGLTTGAEKFSLIGNMMGPWNQAMRTFGGMVVMNFIIGSARRVHSGQALSKVAKGRLAELGLAEDILPRIFEQFRKHGGEGAGRGGRRIDYAPNVGKWADDEIRELMSEAVYRAYDMNLIKGSVLDRPTIARKMFPGMGDEVSKTIFFFLNFGMAANTRILARGLQHKDAAFASGAALSVALGMLTVYLKWQASGREDPPAKDLAGWVKLAVEQSGISGFIFDADRYLDQATIGRFSLSALFDTQGTRYYSPQTTMEAIFGLPVGQLLHATHAAAGFLDGDPDAGDVIRMRRLIPANNTFWFGAIMDSLQEKAVHAVR